MAKFNIQVELDWFDEDSEANIDDELKAAIMSQIISKTVDKLTANLQEEANELMTKKLEEFTLKIGEKLNSLFSGAMYCAFNQLQNSYAAMTELIENEYARLRGENHG